MAEEKEISKSKFQHDILDKMKQPAEVKILAEHTIGEDETLSHIALKHYGNAGRDFWMVIYEFNKAVIGDNPGLVRPGTVLKIPELPDTLKK